MNLPFYCLCCGIFTKVSAPPFHFLIFYFTVCAYARANCRNLFLSSIIYLILFIFKEIVIHLEKNLHSVETSFFLYKREGLCYKYLFHTRTQHLCKKGRRIECRVKNCIRTCSVFMLILGLLSRIFFL